MTTKPTTLQALETEADSYGQIPGGVIRYYFKDGKEIGYWIIGGNAFATDVQDRKWGETFKDRLNITKIK
jgi:hypothetical protein